MIYKLAEFKAWLEADVSRKAGLDWTNNLPRLTTDTHLIKLIERENYNRINFKDDYDYWEPYQKVAFQWKQAVDSNWERHEMKRDLSLSEREPVQFWTKFKY